MFVPFTHYKVAPAVSELTTITSGTTGTVPSKYVGYARTESQQVSPAIGSISSGGPLLSAGDLNAIVTREVSAGTTFYLYLEFDGDMRTPLEDFTKVTLDGNDYLFSSNFYGGTGTYTSGVTLLLWQTSVTALVDSTSYDVQLF